MKVQGLSGPSILMRRPGGRVIRVPLPRHRRRGVGQTCPSWLVPTASGGCIYPPLFGNPNPAPTAVDFLQAPGCHVVDLATNTCMLDDGTIAGCNLIQQCDPLTGSQRCQYGPFPGQTADPNLPFCTSGGPVVHYTPNPLPVPSGPSTPYVPAAAPPPAPVPVVPQQNILPAVINSPVTNPNAPVQTYHAQPVLPSGGPDLSFLTNPVNLFGMSIPVWVIGAVALGGVLLLKRR